VQVLLGRGRKVVIQHKLDFWYVKPAMFGAQGIRHRPSAQQPCIHLRAPTTDVGGYQNACSAGLEAVERSQPMRLRQPGVKRNTFQTDTSDHCLDQFARSAVPHLKYFTRSSARHPSPPVQHRVTHLQDAVNTIVESSLSWRSKCTRYVSFTAQATSLSWGGGVPQMHCVVCQLLYLWLASVHIAASSARLQRTHRCNACASSSQHAMTLHNLAGCQQANIPAGICFEAKRVSERQFAQGP
jgi:hypothetical protein